MGKIILTFILFASFKAQAIGVCLPLFNTSKDVYRLKSVSVLGGKHELFYEGPSLKKNENRLLFLDGISLSFAHSQSMTNHLRNEGVPVVRLDMLGTGHTLKRQIDTQGYEKGTEIPAEKQAQAVIEFIEATSSSPIYLAGESYGGAIAALVAQKRPDLIREVFLVAPHVRDLGDSSPLGQSTSLMAAFNPFLRNAIDQQRRQTLETNFRPLVPRPLKNNLEEYFDALYELSEGVRHFELRDVLQEVAAPVHLLLGSKDKAIPNEWHLQAFERLPDKTKSSIEIIEGAPHDLVVTHSENVAQWIFSKTLDLKRFFLKED